MKNASRKCVHVSLDKRVALNQYFILSTGLSFSDYLILYGSSFAGTAELRSSSSVAPVETGGYRIAEQGVHRFFALRAANHWQILKNRPKQTTPEKRLFGRKGFLFEGPLDWGGRIPLVATVCVWLAHCRETSHKRVYGTY